MGLSDKLVQKIKAYFANELEGRLPGLYDPDTGTAKFSGVNTFDWGDPETQLRGLRDYLRVDADLMARFRDYEDMDQYPEISAALDIYADDSTVIDTQTGRTVDVEADDEEVQKRLVTLYHDNLKVEDEIWGMARTLCKYGNEYNEHIFKEKEGIIGYNNMPPPSVRRVETYKGGLLGFVYDLHHKFNFDFQAISNAPLTHYPGPVAGVGTTIGQTNAFHAEDPNAAVFDSHEVSHFRLCSRYRNSIYGFSVIEAARWIWRRLSLLEDAAMIYKLSRSPARYAFYIDVGQLPPKQALSYVNQVRQKFKKYKFINPSNNKLDFRLNPLSTMDDFFIPVRDGRRASEIDVIDGPSYQSMEDLEYFQNKLFAALKIPKIFLNFEEGTDRSSVSAEDVRFARTVLRVQRELRNGLKRTGKVHLIATGIDPAAVNFEVYMTTPSSIFEMAQLEVQNSRADLASRMQDFMSMHWIMTNVFGLSDSEIELVFRQKQEDALRETKAEIEGRKLEMDMEKKFEESIEIEPGIRASTRPINKWDPAASNNKMAKQLARYNGNLEHMLMDSKVSKRQEKEMAGKVEKLLESDKRLRMKMEETGALLKEVALASRRKAG